MLSTAGNSECDRGLFFIPDYVLWGVTVLLRIGRLLACLACATLPVSGCFLSKSGESKPLAVPSSVAPSEVSSDCPGVPTSSVDLVVEGLSFRPSKVRQSGVVTNVECYGHNNAHSLVFYSHYGKNLTGKDVHDLSNAYRVSRPSNTFPVSGVEGAKGEVILGDDGGGSSIITCGNSFILVSFYPWQELGDNLEVNLRNLALSMVPWVCQGEPVPGLGSPLIPAFSSETATASTSTEVQGDDPAPASPDSSSGH